MDRAFSRVQRFSAEDDPRGHQEKCGIEARIKAGQGAIGESQAVVVIDDEILHIEPLEVRDQEINRGYNGPERLGLLHGQLVEMASEDQDAADDDETDGSV